MDAELPLRSSCAPDGPRLDPALRELPMDEVDPTRRIILLVCTSATAVGVVGRERKAAAAAAEDREALEGWLFKKAWAAAEAAEGLAVDALRGCSKHVSNNSLPKSRRGDERALCGGCQAVAATASRGRKTYRIGSGPSPSVSEHTGDVLPQRLEVLCRLRADEDAIALKREE